MIPSGMSDLNNQTDMCLRPCLESHCQYQIMYVRKPASGCVQSYIIENETEGMRQWEMLTEREGDETVGDGD